MNHEIKQALNEIMDFPPIYRQKFIVDYIRQNLPKDDARRILLEKTKAIFILKMVAEGYITREEVLEKIGKERINQYFHKWSTMS